MKPDKQMQDNMKDVLSGKEPSKKVKVVSMGKRKAKSKKATNQMAMKDME